MTKRIHKAYVNLGPGITKVFDESGTSTSPGKVIYASFSGLPVAKPIPGAIDIDDLVAELEQSPEAAEAIAEGRKWVAETLHDLGPTSR